ncbi:MAG: hypothetical protein PVG65_06915 [Candidatus Thorarchaeota archaeon]|jgi:hypothetical protein
MQIKIEKRYIATIISVILLLAFAGYVIATSGVSHSWEEITGKPDLATKNYVDNNFATTSYVNTQVSAVSKGTLRCTKRVAASYPTTSGNKLCEAWGGVCVVAFRSGYNELYDCGGLMGGWHYSYSAICCKVV